MERLEEVPIENILPVEEEVVKKTGRKGKVKKDTPPKKADNSILVRQLCGLHALVATFTNEPLLMLDEETEAKPLADALTEVLVHYDLSVDPKHAALLNLAFVSGAIYVPKLLMIRAVRAEMRKEALDRAEQTPEKKPSEKIVDEKPEVKAAPVFKEDLHEDLAWLAGDLPVNPEDTRPASELGFTIDDDDEYQDQR